VRKTVIDRARRRLSKALLVVCSLVTLAGVTEQAHAQAQPLPQPVGYVNDFANVIPADAEQRITALAERLNAATRGDMVVVTLPDLGGRPVEEVSLRLGREWKIGADAQIGDAARNAGVVILIVPKETATDGRGRCRIETGQGAEGFLTDATAGALCRAAADRFRAQDYAGAIESIAFEVADRYAAAFNVTLDGQPREVRRSRSRDSGEFPVLLVIIIVLFVLSSFGGRRRRGCVGCIPIPIPGPTMYSGGSSWGGGGFGGGFGGGGGGGFGGFGGGGGFSGGGGGSDW
jgi:uncharacterized protein